MDDTKKVTVGIFWITGPAAEADIIFDSETRKRIGKNFINYKGGHFESWDALSAKQFGGKYKRFDCYHFPRGRVLHDCGAGKTLVYADQKILDRLGVFEPILADMFLLENYEFCSDEHYQSAAEW